MSDPNHRVALDELVELRSEKIASNKDATLPYIGLEHLAQGQPRLLGKLPSSASVSVNCEFAKDDILFGKLRPNLRKSMKMPFAGYCSTDILVLRARPSVRSDFAAQVFQWERLFAKASATAAGTKMPRTSWDELKRFAVFKPESEDEQIRIAAVLDTVDEAIARTESVIGKLRHVRAGLLHDLLTLGLDENGELRDPFRHPEQFQDSSVGRIPKEWVFESLGARFQRIGGAIQTGPFGSQLHANEYTSEGVPVIMPQDILMGSISVAEITRIPTPKADELKRHRVKHGDVIFARRGELSRCAAITPREVGWLCGTGCLLMRFNQSSLSSSWLSLVYRHDFGQRQVACRAVGTTMVNLNQELLFRLKLAFPDRSEQDEIVRQITDADINIGSETENLAKLALMKSGLMNDLLTGRVRVPESIGVSA
jgi:type I restriction enzyme, S subunit